MAGFDYTSDEFVFGESSLIQDVYGQNGEHNDDFAL